jgi:hypothetical protein
MIIRLVESKTSAKDAGDERFASVEPKREEADPISSLLRASAGWALFPPSLTSLTASKMCFIILK